MRTFEGFQHGINLGGWLSQFRKASKQHFDTFITAPDLKAIAALGLDHVRLPVDYEVLEDEAGNPNEEGIAYVDSCVRWCEENGLNMLLDLHKTYGYSFDPKATIFDREVFFNDLHMQERFYSLWRRLAKRYGSNPRIAFDLLNEVVSPDVAQKWNSIAAQAVRIIREYAPNTWLLIGGVEYNHVTSVPLLDPPADDHIVYNFHCYEPLAFTHQKAPWTPNMPKDLDVAYPISVAEYESLAKPIGIEIPLPEESKPEMLGPELFERLFAPAIEYAAKQNAPLYCGEYGVIDQAPAEDSLRWLRDITSVLNKYSIGRALWSYKNMDFGLNEAHYDPIRAEMAKLL